MEQRIRDPQVLGHHEQWTSLNGIERFHDIRRQADKVCAALKGELDSCLHLEPRLNWLSPWNEPMGVVVDVARQLLKELSRSHRSPVAVYHGEQHDWPIVSRRPSRLCCLGQGDDNAL